MSAAGRRRAANRAAQRAHAPEASPARCARRRYGGPAARGCGQPHRSPCSRAASCARGRVGVAAEHGVAGGAGGERERLGEVVERAARGARACAPTASRRRRASSSNGSPLAQRGVAAGVADAQLRVQDGRDAGGAGAQAQLHVLGEQVHGRVERAEPPQRRRVARPGRRRSPSRPCARRSARYGSARSRSARGSSGGWTSAGEQRAERAGQRVRGALDAAVGVRAAAARAARAGCARASAASAASEPSTSSQSGLRRTVTSWRARGDAGVAGGAEARGCPGSSITSAPRARASAAPPSREPLSTTTSCGGSAQVALERVEQRAQLGLGVVQDDDDRERHGGSTRA